MTLDSLYLVVTEAIQRAETLDDLHAPGAQQAHLDVSLIEERIAEVAPASEPEGAVARRGAVRAAVKAKDHQRAKNLADRFLAEDGVSLDLCEEISRLAVEADANATDTQTTNGSRSPESRPK